jgi:CBS domain-containing protein
MREVPMLARDVMTAQVMTIRPDTLIAAAVAQMVAARVSGLPVVDPAGHLVGILTEGDLLRRFELGTTRHRPAWLNFLRGPGQAAADYVRTRTLHVMDIMTPSPISVAPDAPLAQVVGVMEQAKIKRVPVVADGQVIGIISRGDLVRALSGLLSALPVDIRGDAAIQADILAEIDGQGWSAMAHVGVAVDHGRVRLDGIAQTDAVKTALRVAAERVPGVIAVQNDVTIPDPMVMAIGA